MWPSRGDEREVCCIACGERVARSEAREYDKHGDRWEREDKDFEYLCKPCFADLTKCDREDLEATLVDVGAGTMGREEFLARYLDAVEEGRGPVGSDDR